MHFRRLIRAIDANEDSPVFEDSLLNQAANLGSLARFIRSGDAVFKVEKDRCIRRKGVELLGRCAGFREENTTEMVLTWP